MLEHVEHCYCWLQDVESNEITVTYMLLVATSSVPVVLCFSTHRHTHTHIISVKHLFLFLKSCGGASEHVTGLSTELNLMVLCESSSPSQDGSVGSRPTDVQNERNLAPASLYHRLFRYQFPKNWAIIYTPVDGWIWIDWHGWIYELVITGVYIGDCIAQSPNLNEISTAIVTDFHESWVSCLPNMFGDVMITSQRWRARHHVEPWSHSGVHVPIAGGGGLCKYVETTTWIQADEFPKHSPNHNGIGFYHDKVNVWKCILKLDLGNSSYINDIILYIGAAWCSPARYHVLSWWPEWCARFSPWSAWAVATEWRGSGVWCVFVLFTWNWSFFKQYIRYYHI